MKPWPSMARGQMNINEYDYNPHSHITCLMDNMDITEWKDKDLDILDDMIQNYCDNCYDYPEEKDLIKMIEQHFKGVDHGY